MEKISLDTQSMTNLSFQLFQSKAELTIGLVQISHGMAEHKARYLEFIDFLMLAAFMLQSTIIEAMAIIYWIIKLVFLPMKMVGI